jgi:3-oxoacyl-[acyl-carrier-protein] synthase-1
LAGLVAEDLFPPDLGEFSPAADRPRLLRLLDAALERLRPEVEAALEAYGPSRVGLCLGSCDNGAEGSLAAHAVYYRTGAFPADYELALQGAAYPAEYAARTLGLGGPCLAVSTACASSAGALVKGAEFIRAGLCDAVVAGGVDVASATALLGFDALEAVSDAPCNPFSKNRRGITLGEGAAFFLLTREPRGPSLALLGWGESADAYHITAPRPDGSGAARAMERALQQAGLKAAAVDYVNLHGTGTPLNDAMEARALAAVFPRLSRGPPLSSTKPLTGHTLGAAGALELAFCWLALSRAGGGPGALPVHCWDGVRDEALPALPLAAAGTVAETLRVCMSNSFAFGGCNISLIIGRED